MLGVHTLEAQVCAAEQGIRSRQRHGRGPPGVAAQPVGQQWCIPCRGERKIVRTLGEAAVKYRQSQRWGTKLQNNGTHMHFLPVSRLTDN